MPPTDPAQWPERLIALSRAALEPGSPACARSREEFWLLVGVVLRQRAAAAAYRAGGLTASEIEDAVSDKLLELVARFDTRRWDPARSHPGEVVNFLTTVARNAVVDLLRARDRRVHVQEDEIEHARIAPEIERDRAVEPPEARVERQRFIRSLVACAGRLPPRDRTIWVLRAVLELPSREIASHPDVRLRHDHVDVILQRCRERLRVCMGQAGLGDEPPPRGTFAALWEAHHAGGRGGGS